MTFEEDIIMRKIEFSQDDYKNIVDMYQSGKSQSYIAGIYNCSESTMCNVMKQLKISTRSGGSKNTPDIINKWIKMYLNGAQLKDIAQEFNTNYRTVSTQLKKNGIEIDRYTYHFNEHYFDNIDSQEKAYIMGMLWADGHNCVSRGSIILELQESDIDLLEKINILTGNERPLRKQNLHLKNENWKDQYKLVWQSKYTSNVLESYGMVQGKSLVLKFPEWLGATLYAHFIHGYFDGDGCISLVGANKNRSANINMIGTRMFLERVANIIKDSTGANVFINRDERAREPICILRCSIRNDVINILNWLYQDSTIYMQRKYDKYQQFLNNINNSCCA